MDNIRIQVGARVRELRKKIGWSQEELADRAGLHNTYINQIERGKRNVSIENVQKIAKAFDLTLAELLDFPRARLSEKQSLEYQIINTLRSHKVPALKYILQMVRALKGVTDRSK